MHARILPLRRRHFAGLGFALLVLHAGGSRAEAPASESAVKAAYLYKFGSFVEWPPGTIARVDESFVIGVAGDDAVASELEQLAAGRRVEGRPLVVRRVRDPQAPGTVHILFIAGTREARLREFMPAASAPVLVVAEQEGALRLGASINFSAEGGRVRFSAAPGAAEARGLRLSSRLLAVAQSIEGRKP